MEFTTNYGWNKPEPTDPVNSSAEYAENMESIDGIVKDIADEVTAVDDGLTALAQTVGNKVNKNGDTMTGALHMSGSKVDGLATPTQANDAATKAYVDNKGSNYINKDGSVAMEADLPMGGCKVTNLKSSGPFNANDAIPKWYMIENAVTYAEGLTADLNANNNTISALATPTYNYDAATKKYVDDKFVSFEIHFDRGTVTVIGDYEKVTQAINNNKIVVAYYISDATNHTIQTTNIYRTPDASLRIDFNYAVRSDALTIYSFTWNADGTITRTTFTINN